MNETISHALVSGGVPAVLEPVSVCHNDGKRPDGMSLIPWSWGYPCSGTLPVQTPWPHLIYLLLQVVPAGWQTLQSAKFRKYSSLIPSFHFSPLCVETLGAWGSCARSLVRRIGSRAGPPREIKGPRAKS